MGKNVAKKLIESHLVSGEMKPGEEIGIKIDQTLTQDATGTMVMLELEAMGIDRVKTEVSVQYVDHNLIQGDYKNPDDHRFLQSAAARFGVWFSRPGNGISHPVHMESFGIPGKTMLGSDSHTPAGGSIGMLAIGAGGLEVALAMAGEPFYTKMPKIMGVKLTGRLSDWVSAKDVILELLRRHDVSGGVGKIIEYYGPGVETLSVWDRHVITNMGAELGATTSVFASDDVTRQYFRQVGREQDWIELTPDAGATYDEHDEIDLSKVEPLIAMPCSPGNVVPVRQVAGKPIAQAYLGSSANPGMRDFAISALMVEKRKVDSGVSFDVNPSSRAISNYLIEESYMARLTKAGARIHQAGCNGCIGMGQAPATDTISLRTVPRNFPGRSGTKEDKVYLCSPETATASALTGKITDPRDLGMNYPKYSEPEKLTMITDLVKPPKDGSKIEIIKGPNIGEFPVFGDLPDTFSAHVILKVGTNISTDDISPAGAQVLPYRSNIPEISKFTYYRIDPTFYERAMDSRDKGSIIVAEENYGQGSSREHAAISPKYLGIRAVIAKSYARIHRKNLINFGIVPFTFRNPEDYEKIRQGDVLTLKGLHAGLKKKEAPITLHNDTKDETYELDHSFSKLELEALLCGGLINWVSRKHQSR